MARLRFKTMEVPESLRRLVYDFKSENPNKKIPDILDDIAKNEFERRKKRRGDGVGFNYF